ncbi:MAG: M56 family metallopeptidase, partial [Planctomycetales bacterium]
MPDAVLGPVLAWLLTYAAHSTIALSAARLITAWMGNRSPRAQDVIWKTAMLAGLFTATAHATLGLQTLGGNWILASTTTSTTNPTATTNSATSTPATLSSADQAPVPRTADEFRREHQADWEHQTDRNETDQDLADWDWRREEDAAAAPILTSAPADSSGRDALPSTFALGWTRAILGSWLLGAGVAISVFIVAWKMLAARLRLASWEITEGPLLETLQRLLRQSKMKTAVRLTCSPRIQGPVALGSWRPRICVPVRATSELSREQQESMLAHELAHLHRGDPAWLTLFRVLECVFFFQPLNRFARLWWQETAEYLCDSWVVEQTGRPLDLAKCLTEVAQWTTADSRFAPTWNMAAPSSQLGRRVRRLLDDANRSPSPSAWLETSVGLVVGVLLLAFVAPVVTATHSADRKASSPGDPPTLPREPSDDAMVAG